jgi:hypothetical protein
MARNYTALIKDNRTGNTQRVTISADSHSLARSLAESMYSGFKILNIS